MPVPGSTTASGGTVTRTPVLAHRLVSRPAPFSRFSSAAPSARPRS
jgi:hypothetical protein